jgi:hypothetical protein
MSEKEQRTTEELVVEALRQLGKDPLEQHEYEIHYVIPYNEDGGEIRGVISNFVASSSAEAVRYVSEMMHFPEIDPDTMADNSKEYADLDRYGIVKVRKVLNEPMYTGEDLMKSWDFIFNNYYREVNLDGARLKDSDNREEMIIRLINLFKLPGRNKLTDKYNI